MSDLEFQFKVKNANGNTVTMGKRWKTDEPVLSLVLNVRRHYVKTSLLTADCSKFLPQRRETLGCRSWKAVSVVQPVPRSMMNAGVLRFILRNYE